MESSLLFVGMKVLEILYTIASSSWLERAKGVDKFALSLRRSLQKLRLNSLLVDAISAVITTALLDHVSDLSAVDVEAQKAKLDDIMELCSLIEWDLRRTPPKYKYLEWLSASEGIAYISEEFIYMCHTDCGCSSYGQSPKTEIEAMSKAHYIIYYTALERSDHKVVYLVAIRDQMKNKWTSVLRIVLHGVDPAKFY